MLSVVIVSYNTRDLLRQCLLSLRDHAPAAEVVVADNASRDGSADMVAAGFPGVKLVRLAENVGFAGGNNAALPLTAGDPVLLLNSDTVVFDDALDRCVRYMGEHPRVGALSARLLGPDGKPQGCAHAFPSLRDDLRVAFRRPPPRVIESGVTDGWLAGTALFIRRAALEQAGGRLDDGYFMYWEDADLSARIRAGGWELAVHPEATVRHYGGASGGGADAARRPDLQAWYDYGRLRWYARHKPWPAVAGMFLYEWTRATRMRLRGLIRPSRGADAAHAGALARALLRWPFGTPPPRPGRHKE